MKTIFVIYISLFGASVAYSGDGEAVRGAGSSGLAHASAQLPHCVEDQDKLSAIHAWEKANTSSSQKYGELRKQLSSDTDEELMTRLVYSETLAANCPENNAQIVSPIAAVIANRVAKEKDVKSAIFRRDQFASSLNFYGQSRIKDFLCPKNADLWRKAQEAAQKQRTKRFLLRILGITIYFRTLPPSPFRLGRRRHQFRSLDQRAQPNVSKSSPAGSNHLRNAIERTRFQNGP